MVLDKRSGWFVLAMLIASCVALPRSSRSDEIDDFVPYRGERNSSFDWNLLKNMFKCNQLGGNFLVSPISLKLALVLLYEGAQDETALELENVMGLPAGRLATRDKYSNVIKSLQLSGLGERALAEQLRLSLSYTHGSLSTLRALIQLGLMEQKPEYKLDFGSRIFMDQSMVPRQRYGAIAEAFYRTNIFSTNFSDPHSSAETINGYVKNLTSGKIPKIIDDESGLQDSLMMIVNAMFFKGTWYRQPFNPNDTITGQFSTRDGRVVDVPYMRATSKFYTVYADDLDAKILRLPYKGHKYSMYIVLPDTPGKLDEVVQKITPAVLNKYLWSMQEVPADIMIPKFKFDHTSHLAENLKEMGIRDIFKDTATLTYILKSKTTSRRLSVSDIMQKTGIEVSEEGTVAFVASEIEIGNKMSEETFHATQPFLFYIEDESNGSVLYMGVVNDPLEESPEAEPLETSPSRICESECDRDADSAVALGYNDRQNFFNIDLLQSLNNASPGNVIAGTSSVKSALMVLAEAASGKTRDQIISVLRLPTDITEIRNIAKSNLTPLKTAGTELQQAIKLWLGKDVPLIKNFSETLQQFYKGDLQGVNFSDAANTVRTINDWARKFTNGRINSIVDPTSLAPDTRMLLTTAVYFKGTWQHAFDKTATRTRCFDVPGTGCHQVPLMENVANYKYAEVPALDAQVVQIPYTGEQASMVILLPTNKGEQALRDLSRDLAHTTMASLLASLKEQELLLQIPKFSVRSQIDMRSQLQELGIRELFEDNANLSAAFPRGNVKVGGVIHNAQIDVNEEGTVASAVTGVSVIPLMGSSLTHFRADRPFLFFILENATNGILFAGRFVKPDQPSAIPEVYRSSYVKTG